jgi:hypothetical protein
MKTPKFALFTWVGVSVEVHQVSVVLPATSSPSDPAVAVQPEKYGNASAPAPEFVLFHVVLHAVDPSVVSIE